jgi:hypothetical protein
MVGAAGLTGIAGGVPQEKSNIGPQIRWVNAPAKLSKIDKLRLRDGDRCWLCSGNLGFGAARMSKKMPTLTSAMVGNSTLRSLM